MVPRIGPALALICLLVIRIGAGPACSLCTPSPNTATLRDDAVQATLVLYGTLSNPRLDPAAPGSGPDGAATDLAIDIVLKDAPLLAGRKTLVLPRYVPVDPKNPGKFLVFCAVDKGKIDPFRGSPASRALVDYVTAAAALAPSDSASYYSYFGRFLDSADPDVAADAFREFARAGDADIARAAKQLDPVRIRKLLTAPTTPPERLSLLAYLLGACGSPADADVLARMLREPDERTARAFGGLLAGYTQLRPDDGWRLILQVLPDSRQPFSRRLATLGTVRFFYRSQPAARPRAVQTVAALLPLGDMADLAVEDLRQWHEWGATAEVLAQYGKASHAAPMVRRAIVRYALTCPRPESRQFVEQLRRADPQLLREVEESLEFEKEIPRPAGK
jgi:hypothetical protein